MSGSIGASGKLEQDDANSEFFEQNWSLTGRDYEPDAETLSLYRDARDGRFAENFAAHEFKTGVADALGADRDWLLKLGNDLFGALATRGHYGKAVNNLRRVIRRLIKETGSKGKSPRAAAYYVQYVCSIQDELQRRQDHRSSSGKYHHIFGVVVGALEYWRDRGIKPNTSALYGITRRLACASATDTETAIRHYCRDRPLADWLKPRR